MDINCYTWADTIEILTQSGIVGLNTRWVGACNAARPKSSIQAHIEQRSTHEQCNDIVTFFCVMWPFPANILLKRDRLQRRSLPINIFFVLSGCDTLRTHGSRTSLPLTLTRLRSENLAAEPGQGQRYGCTALKPG